MGLGLALGAAVATTSCVTPTTVVVGSPYERYDHNRTRLIVTPSALCATNRIDRVEIYSPMGSGLFPRAQLEGAATPDSLPAANLVPVFTGIPLPLSDVTEKSGRSDRADLLVFLNRPLLAGIRGPRGAVDFKRLSQQYQPVLDFLGNQDDLSWTNREQMIQRLLSRRVISSRHQAADQVIDARYNLPNSFGEVFAFRFKSFWFILYKLRAETHFSRLVVVSKEISGRDLRSTAME